MADATNILDWLNKPRARRSGKYNNRRCEIHGEKFDSELERDRWLNLRLLERAGEISQLRRQVAYELIPEQKRPSGGVERACSYVADFVYVDKAGRTVVEDVKGAVTPEFRLKRKLMLQVHGVEVLLT